MSLRVFEVFDSIQGEGTRAGRRCCFIRLAGCPLRCTFCDTTYAFLGGESWELDALVDHVKARMGEPSSGPEAPFIEVTGGEPLAQAQTPLLLSRLLELGFEVALETAGSHDLAQVPGAVIKIVDRKTPGSGESHRWLESNLDWMVAGRDELKFVLADEADYHWAREWCEACGVWNRLTVLFSPVTPGLDPRWLAERIIADRLPVRFQVQLHKIVWPPEMRGV